MADGVFTLLADVVLVQGASLSATGGTLAMMQGIALKTGNAGCRGVTGAAVGIAADYTARGEFLISQIAIVTDQTSLVGHAEGTSTDVTERYASITLKSIA